MALVTAYYEALSGVRHWEFGDVNGGPSYPVGTPVTVSIPTFPNTDTDRMWLCGNYQPSLDLCGFLPGVDIDNDFPSLGALGFSDIEGTISPVVFGDPIGTVYNEGDTPRMFGTDLRFGTIELSVASTPTLDCMLTLLDGGILVSAPPDFTSSFVSSGFSYSGLSSQYPWGVFFDYVDAQNFGFFTLFLDGHYGRVMVVQGGVATFSFDVPLMGSQKLGAAPYNGFEPFSARSSGSFGGVVGAVTWSLTDSGVTGLSWTWLQLVRTQGKLVLVQHTNFDDILFPGFSQSNHYVYSIDLPNRTPAAKIGMMGAPLSYGGSIGGIVAPAFWRAGLDRVGYQPASTTDTSALRLGQRNDGLGLSGSPRLRAGVGPTSRQQSAAPRVGLNNTYS